MIYTVSVTTQGQISIPAKLRRQLGFDKTRKAKMTLEGDKVLIEPIVDLLELGGSMKTNLKISPKAARRAFTEYLAGRYTQKGQ